MAPRNSGPSLTSLISAYAWRWLVAFAACWVISAVVLVILTVIIMVVVAAATGATTPEALEKPTALILSFFMIFVGFVVVPVLSGLIAFIWVLYSSEIRNLVQPPGSSSPKSAAIPGASAGGADPYTQYTLAYQRWQKDYATFQESRKPASVPESAVEPSLVSTDPIPALETPEAPPPATAPSPLSDQTPDPRP